VTRQEFVEWFSGDFDRLVGSVALVCGSRQLAEEAVAEAFTRAFARRSRFDEAKPSGWIFRVAMNELKMRWRRDRLENRWLGRQRPETLQNTEPDPELWAAVAELPQRQREVIALRYIAEYSQPEVADALGISVGTVASTLHDARQALGRALDREESMTCG